jgi:predicted helicase
MNALFNEFIKGHSINSFEQFSSLMKISDLNTKQIGDIFEVFCKYFFELIPYLDTEKYYIYPDIPDDLRQRLKLPKQDRGIDAIVKRKDRDWEPIQVKWRTDRKTIPWGELSTFESRAFVHCSFTHAFLFTNSNDVCREFKESKSKYTNFVYADLYDLCNDEFWKDLYDRIDGIQIIKKEPFTPRKHQCEILDIANEYYSTHDYGRLYAPCGIGKTLIGYWISQNLNVRNMLVLVPSLNTLSDIYKAYRRQTVHKDVKYLLIGSDIDTIKDDYSLFDITTHYDDIKDFMTINAQCEKIIISTYQSSWLMNKYCTTLNYQFDIVVYDESHRTVGKDATQFSHMVKSAHTKYKLFMTATEKVFNFERSQLDLEEQDKILSMDDEEIYGKIIHTYSTRKAIDDDQLVDYRLIAPLISEHDTLSLVDKHKYIDINGFEQKYDSFDVAICISLLNAMKEYKFKHVLVYCNKNKRAYEINKLLINISDRPEYECLDISHKIKQLSGEMSMNKRRAGICDFESSERSIICSARIFNEGVNIPICDAVCFIDNRSSTVDIIQCVGRCLRKCEVKPDKIGHVIIPFIIKDSSDEISFFNREDHEFSKIYTILKALGTTDDQITDIFIVIDGLKKHHTDNQPSEEIETFGKQMDLSNLSDKILIKVFNRDGRPVMSDAKRMILRAKLEMKTKENYRKLCDTNPLLPHDPEDVFGSQFKGWIDYLNINRDDYYDYEEFQIKVPEVIHDHNIFVELDLLIVSKTCTEFDKQFPPYDLWTEFYEQLNDLTDIIKSEYNDTDIVIF